MFTGTILSSGEGGGVVKENRVFGELAVLAWRLRASTIGFRYCTVYIVQLLYVQEVLSNSKEEVLSKFKEKVLSDSKE